MLWRCGVRLLQLQPKHSYKRSLCGHLRIDHHSPHWPKSVLSKIVHALHDRSVWPRRNSGSEWTTLITDSCGLLIVPTVVWQAMGRCLRLLGGGARRVLGVQQDSLPHADQHFDLCCKHCRCCRSASNLMTTKQPAFLCAFLYVCLGYIVIRTGPQYCRVTPKMYAAVCITGDFFSLVIQAIGGGVSCKPWLICHMLTNLYSS